MQIGNPLIDKDSLHSEGCGNDEKTGTPVCSLINPSRDLEEIS